MQDIEHAKHAVVHGSLQPLSGIDEALALSWTRSAQSIGSPWASREVPYVDLRDVDTGLEDVLHRPLSHMAQSLDDTGIVLILADAEGRILHCWSSDDKSKRHMEQASTGPGSVVAECAIGTNAAGTALVTGKPILVRGSEHYVELYSRAACAAAPVRHPRDGRVLGVVTLGMTDQPDVRFLLPMTKMLATHLKSHLAARLNATGRLPFADDRLPSAHHPARSRIEQLEIEAIQQALAESGGLREGAARRLGWSRSTLYRRMRTYQLNDLDVSDAG